MTSKHLFFKAMRDDLRHKTWMLALSILGSFIILPVAWLMFRDNLGGYTKDLVNAKYYIRETLHFFEEYVMLLGAIFTGAGALIVGLWGFRFLHHKNMVDTWHSLPIKRNTLFGAYWMNGFLLWLVPFATAMLITCLMAAGTLISVNATYAIGSMLATAGTSFLVLLIIFLLVYNLILVAVMLSGNILNTLVSMVVLGFSVVGVFVLGIAFLDTYMSTFYTGSINLENMTYFSPFISAGYMIYARIEYMQEPVKIWTIVGINSAIAMALGVGSWFLYKRRSSELAEQGIKNKPLITLMKLIVGAAAGMFGWMVLLLMVNERNFVWGIFGCTLVTVVVFGIMDIVFHMDFKAFFKHKLYMGVTVVLSLLICFAFYCDWLGYDQYLPNKEDIAEIAVYESGFTNRSYYRDDVEALGQIQIQDVDAAYAFLERVIKNSDSRFSTDSYSTIVSEDGEYDVKPKESRNIYVRVGLKNGKSYYRNYYISNYDKDVLWPLITSKEYLREAYALGENEMKYCTRMHFDRNDLGMTLLRNASQENMIAIMDAYNKDLSENPDNVLANNSSLLVEVRIDIETPKDSYDVFLDVYETMSNTVAKLRELGYGEWVDKLPAENVSEIQLRLGIYPDWNTTPEQLIAYARDMYGVYEPGQTYHDLQEIFRMNYDYRYDYDLQQKEQTMFSVATREYMEEPYLSITEPEDITEILELLSYSAQYRYDLFRGWPLYIQLVTTKGEIVDLNLPKGVLPEKYILRFGQLNIDDFVDATGDT